MTHRDQPRRRIAASAKLAAVGITLVVLAIPQPARAQIATTPHSAVAPSQTPPTTAEAELAIRPSPFHLNVWADLPVTLTGLVSMWKPEWLVGSVSSAPPPLLRPRDTLNPMDRTVVGNASQGAASASDALLYMNIAFPFVASLVEAFVSPDGMSGLGSDAMVLAETLAINSLLCRMVKLAVRRPRPFVYDPATPDAERNDETARQSFFSGHTSMSFAMATSYSYLFMLRHPRSKWVIPVWVGTHALAASTALMRVRAGRHFWSDVLVGAAVGSFVGWAVPWLHRKAFGGKALIDESNPLYHVRLAPTFHQKGFGLTAMLMW